MGKKYLREDKSGTSLFAPPKSTVPLAERIRPRDFSEFVGQNHLVGSDGTIRKMIESGNIRPMILWGPAGSGKTTLARIIANKIDADFFQVNAISSGVKEMREIISHAESDLESILSRALTQDEFLRNIELTKEAKNELIRLCGGDARVMLNALELSLSLSNAEEPIKLDKDKIREAYQVRHYKYDKGGEEHYNTISAFIKSVRGSDPDAAVYYLARMLEAGEDPKFIARRLIILASEDIGNAEPYALTLATACFTAVDYIGMPEALLILAQTTTYLASCPKSNASFLAIEKALNDVREKPYIPVPIHLRNAPTELMKGIGYGKNYKYAHDYNSHFIEQQYLPDELKDKIYYEPTDIGKEATLKKYLEKIWKRRRK